MTTENKQRRATDKLTPQERFDRCYISTNEIASLVGVTRATILNARKEGKLPGSISLDGFNFYLWEREQIQPTIDAWVGAVRAKREFETVASSHE